MNNIQLLICFAGRRRFAQISGSTDFVVFLAAIIGVQYSNFSFDEISGLLLISAPVLVTNAFVFDAASRFIDWHQNLIEFTLDFLHDWTFGLVTDAFGNVAAIQLFRNFQ